MAAAASKMKLGAGALCIGLLYAAFSKPDLENAAEARPQADPFAFVRSMEGTRPDGDVKLGADGQLVVDAELGHLFDYYLAGLGEKDLDAIRSEIERELERRFKPGPAAQAKRLLASYLSYKRALAGLEQGLKPGADMASAARARLQAMQKLRRNYFTASEIAGLFGFSDAYDLDSLARIEVSLDQKLSAAQRTEKLAELDLKLSPAMREERDAPTRVIRTEESVQKMRENGASDDEVYRVRAAAFSTEAAARLADLDREEAQWKGRIQRYLAERSVLPAGAAAAMQQLRDKYFSVDEQRRLGAYE
ncbi:MAG: lipase secretion chaperone [Pseudomonadota bacterium]